MAVYSRPGVYVEEISTFPTSVVRVATAVPVLIGYTEKSGSDVKQKPIRITSLIDYETLFGGEPDSLAKGRRIEVQLKSDGTVNKVTVSLKFYLYHCLRHFYANGGGDAYIYSLGTYDDPYVGFPANGFSAGNWDTTDGSHVGNTNAAFDKLEEADEPTLILTPDAYALIDPVDLGEVQAAALAHCNKMQDRFAIFDLQHNTLLDALGDANAFRTNVGNNYLKYGAAYYPELKTTLGPTGNVALEDFTLVDLADDPVSLDDLATASADPNLIAYNQIVADLLTLPDGVALAAAYAALPDDAAALTDADFRTQLLDKGAAIKSAMQSLYNLGGSLTNPAAKAFVLDLIDAGSALNTTAQTLLTYDTGFADILGVDGGPVPLGGIEDSDFDGTGYPPDSPDYTLVAPALGAPPLGIYATTAAAFAAFEALFNSVMDELAAVSPQLTAIRDELKSNLFATSKVFADILLAIRNTGYILPPSGAMAGVYASVDANRGVWKAPANVSLTAVTEVRKLRGDELDDLNVSANTGKSINAIRAFRGQGTLVYGARTLAGNDNEWRYVPVRRLFIMVEESVKKAVEPYVFEPNTANTWMKIKGMIENFLFGLWRDGALAGAVPKDAFFVNVGLGQTMTADDILNGRLLIEIGMAAVRPAEFVILKFSHKMQES